MVDLLHKDKCYAIVGACMNVHSQLGSGFLESVYAEALGKEFKKRNIPFVKEKKLELYYDGEKMNKYFKADFICFDSIIVELKSKSCLLKIDEQQTVNYLKATNYQLGLLVNFGEKSLRYKRFVNTDRKEFR
ncbi:GxxExxY protein [Labilibaculum sp. A4]|uniref:GxxExxY protein n=1 Tax=Labilibaculum euxinus TaxID=2686357 RepID=UPI000F627B64|nr:GxxExxY protein [Labilibaculum euxinus]MDQ1772715.1 GxxExxY protein [Labilibaculum euxinus]MWN78327.1 GxxExxY protein [Labilibaculum euxinus]